MQLEIFSLLLAGAFGALLKEVVVDNKLTLPKKLNGELTLGFLGALIVGAFAGWAIDGSLLTAAMAGFSGFAIIEQLIEKKSVKINTDKTLIEAIIRYVAKTECVNPDLCVKVAECESDLNPTARFTNNDLSIDRGLFQINNKFHPEISDAQADDIVLSTRFFCKAFKEGHLSWWNATKNCWG